MILRSLRLRLILSNLLPLLIVLPFVGFLMIYLLETQGIVAGVSRDLTRQAVLVADTAGLQPSIWMDPNSADLFLKRISPRLSARLMLLDSGGRVLASSEPSDEGLIGKILYTGEYQSVEDLSRQENISTEGAGEVVVPVVRADGLLLGFVRMDNPLSPLFERSNQLRQVALWVVAAGLIFGVALGWLLSRDISRQLRAATEAVTNLATGKDLALLDGSDKLDEVGRLYGAFNTLVERLRNLEENRKRLLANLVHELGRPLGSLRSAVHALKGGAEQDRELHAELLDGMDGELRRLDHLVGDLANLHNELAGTLILKRAPLDIADWLQKITGTYREEAISRGLDWSCDVPSDLPVINLDSELLTLAVQNLISNAIRYTPAGGKVKIKGYSDTESLYIEVADTGPGIKPEELQRIFEPFTRGSSARRFSQGMGLGLTIARDMVEAHGGTLQVESEPEAGSTFRIQIPIRSS